MTDAPTIPVAGPGVAQPGHNRRSGYQDTFDEFLDALRAQLKGLDVWEQRETLDDELAPRANDFVKGLKKLRKEGDDSRRAEKRPHEDGAKEVDARWKKELDKIDKALAVVTPKVDAYLKAKEKERRDVEIAAHQARQQAERDAEAARADAAHANTASQRIEAEARAEEAERQAKAAAKDAKAATGPARVDSATGLANKTSLRTVWDVAIEDRRKAIAYFLLTDPEAFDERIKQLAGEALRAAPIVGGVKQVPEIAGLKFTSEKVFK